MILPTILAKEVHRLLRDRGALLSMFLLPLAFMAVFGFMFRRVGGEREERQALAVFAAPGVPRLERVVQDLEASGYFRVQAETSPEAVERRVASEEAAAGLVLPADFGTPGVKAVVYADTGQPKVTGPIVGTLSGLLARGGAPEAPPVAEAPPVVDVRPPAGMRKPIQDLDAFQVTVPGNAVLFIFFLASAVAVSFVEERKTGAWRRLLAAPVSRWSLLVAKLVPFFLIGLLQMAIFFLVGTLGFGMRVAGSLAGVAVVSAAVVFCAVAMGLVIAAFGGTEKQVTGFTSMVVLVLALLGGALFPRLLMPPAMKQLGNFTPHAWALDAYYDLLIREGTTLSDVSRPLLILVGIGVAMVVSGIVLFRFERA